jgi:replicative DNA helicase
VKEYSIRRQIMFGFGECCRNAADEMHDVFEVLNQSELILSDIKTGIIRNRRSNKQDVLNKLIESMKNIESIGIGLTGMSEVDRVIGRAEPGDMILVAGRPGMGKSMLANTMARHVGIEQGLKTLFWALEMTSMQNLRRQISNVGNLDYGYLKRAEVDYPAFDKATQIILSSALEYEDRTGVTAMDVRSRLISQQRLTGLNFAIVDHGGLLNNMNTRNNNEVTEISKTTKLLKQTAKDLNIPIVVLWQLNREVEKRAGCVPKISDLRDSGSLEQDADKIIFIYRPEYYGINQYTIGEDTYETKGLAVAMVEKNREGEPGRALMRFNPWNMRFEAWQGENSKATSDIPF